MAKYVANPVEVDAFKIAELMDDYLRPSSPSAAVIGMRLRLENNEQVMATSAMCARMAPKVGDYWVIQSDGYVYLNPKEVFERKYHPKGD